MEWNSEIVHIDWAEETHTLCNTSSVDILPTSPQIEETPDGLKLQLFPQQRVISHALLKVEEKGYIESYLPPLQFPHDIILREGGSVGRFVSDMWIINMKVGSGKTAIMFAMIAKRRVPPRKTSILGVDAAHATLMCHSSELKLLPKTGFLKSDRAMDWPAYFTEEGDVFPSYKPHEIRVITPSIVLPTNIFLVGAHLYKQMIGYCKKQVTFPWRGLENRAEMFSFIVEACLDPAATFDNLHLLVVPAELYGVSGYQDLKELIDNVVRDQVKNYDGTRRLQAMLKLMTQSREASSVEILSLYQYTNGMTDPAFYARVFYDDYDALKHFDCGRIHALTHGFISSTHMQPQLVNFGYTSKLLYTKYARMAASISVLPKKLETIMNLGECIKKDIVCTESYLKEMVEISLKGLFNCAAASLEWCPSSAWTEVLPTGVTTHRMVNKLKGSIDDLIRIINADATKDVVEGARRLNDLFHDFGIHLFEKVAPTRIEEVFNCIIRAYICLRNVITLMSVSGKALSEAIEKAPRPEMAGLYPLWLNYTTAGHFPVRQTEFNEMAQHKDDVHIVTQLTHTIKPPNSFKEIVDYLTDNPHGAYNIGPYIIRYLNNLSNISDLRRLVDLKSLNKTTEQYGVLAGMLLQIAFPAVKCVRCKGPCNTMYYLLSGCGEPVCDKCYDKAVVLTEGGMQCSICGRFYNDHDIVSTPISTQVIAEYKDSIAEIGRIKLKIQDSVYAPQIAQLLKSFATQGGVAAETAYRTRVIGGKITEIVNLLKELLVTLGRPPAVLIYNESTTGADELSKAINDIAFTIKDGVSFDDPLAKEHLKGEMFISEKIDTYREKKVHVIICKALSDFMGLNMEYLDCVIFYSPCRDPMLEAQVIGRGYRVGRNKEHKLHIYTLYYPSEFENLERVSSTGDAEMRAFNARVAE